MASKASRENRLIERRKMINNHFLVNPPTFNLIRNLSRRLTRTSQNSIKKEAIFR